MKRAGRLLTAGLVALGSGRFDRQQHLFETPFAVAPTLFRVEAVHTKQDKQNQRVSQFVKNNEAVAV